MIAYVKGELTDISEESVVVEVNGIGYNVKVPATTLDKLPPVGENVKLHTYTLVREDAFLLYGFLTKSDLNLFRKLITVNGIGPKGGLSILSGMDADSLKIAILSGDVKAISKIPGIGSKTAERMILDLKDKVSYEEVLDHKIAEAVPVSGAMAANMKDAVEALTSLGYGQAESLKAVKSVPNAGELDTGTLLKAALKYMF